MYAASNIGYVKTQTQQAMAAENIDRAKFFAYKALNAIEKSKTQLKACGCDYAIKSINEGLENLKKATRTTTLNGTKLFLQRALENTLSSLEALEEHELHDIHYTSDVLAMNTKSSEKGKMPLKHLEGKVLEEKIDKALVNFQNSINQVVISIDCKDAYVFTNNIYKNCEQELLKANLSESKKYYNLRTKEIVAEALIKLENCYTEQ